MTIASATTNPSRECSSLRPNENTRRSRKHLCAGENASIESVTGLQNEKERDERRARANEWTARRQWRRSPRRCASRQTAWQRSLGIYLYAFAHIRAHTCARLGCCTHEYTAQGAAPALSECADIFPFAKSTLGAWMRILKKNRIRIETKSN